MTAEDDSIPLGEPRTFLDAGLIAHGMRNGGSGVSGTREARSSGSK